VGGISESRKFSRTESGADDREDEREG